MNIFVILSYTICNGLKIPDGTRIFHHDKMADILILKCHFVIRFCQAPPCGHTKNPANPRRARPPSINKPAQRTATRLRLPSTVYLCRLVHSITGRGIIVKAGLTVPYGFAILMLEPVDVRELVSAASVLGTAGSVFMPFWLAFSLAAPPGDRCIRLR